MEESKVPVFSVLKKGTTIKNIILNSPTSEIQNPSSKSKAEDPILFGRHPDCHIVVDHPSISRFHLEVRSIPLLQKLYVKDRSSVHGTWISGKRILPNIPVELIEGDTVRLGVSTRIYQLHWLPLSHAFDISKPMSPLLEETSFCENEEVIQENLKETFLGGVPSQKETLETINLSLDNVEYLEFQGEEQRSMRKEMVGESSCFPSIVLSQEFGNTSQPSENSGHSKFHCVNEMSLEVEEKNPFEPVKKFKSSSLLSRRNKSVSFLRIERTNDESRNIEECVVGSEITNFEDSDSRNVTGEIPSVHLSEVDGKEEEEEKFHMDEEKTPVQSTGSELMASYDGFEKSPRSAVRLLGLLAEPCDSDKENQTPVASTTQISYNSGLKLHKSLSKPLGSPLCEKNALTAEQDRLHTVKEAWTPDNPKSEKSEKALFRGLLEAEKDEVEAFLSDKENLTPQMSRLREPKEINVIIHGKTDKESGKCKKRPPFQLLLESSPMRMSSSVSYGGLDVIATDQPLGENNVLNVEEDRIHSDKENSTPDISKSAKSGKALFRSLLETKTENEQALPSDKKNLTPQMQRFLKTKELNDEIHSKPLEESMKKKKERSPFQPLFESSPMRKSNSISNEEDPHKKDSINFVNSFLNLEEKASAKMKVPSHMLQREKKKWYIIVDVGCFLAEESWKSLQLLQGIRGTQLIIPRIVIRELDHLQRCEGLFSRGTKASSILKWIEECMMNSCWWIHVQNSSETFPAAPTPPATPRSQLCDGMTENFVGFSACGSLMEIVSPTAEDHILDCALLFKRIKFDGELVLLTCSTTLRIKAMAEGLLCETPKEFRESLVNPCSNRFLWTESSPRGSTWSCSEEVGLPGNCCHQFTATRRTPKAAEGGHGLKLVLLHNYRYLTTNSVK
ncbi:hypothetical protein HPP92_018806 [Vanilla planifolia]|uniref:FHA domain-containing protein n=1 Tax=Vanilla planifolia TaxID=51239 RepID=A0A835Q8C1_VANPL|nr:hypothetical protein HPP92_018806 [Vanilla planifolia]